MSTGDYYLGLLFFLVTYGAAGAAATVLVRRRFPQLAGATRILAWSVLATLGLVAAHLVPAMFAALSRETAAVAAVAILGATLALPASPAQEPLGFPAPIAPASRTGRLLAVFGVAGFVIWMLLALRQNLYRETEAYDALSAYMPIMARWLQEGSIWEVVNWVPNVFYGSGPGHGGLIVLSSVLPWDNDFLAHLITYPFVALTAFALYVLGRELGSPAPPAALAGVMLAATPMVVVPGITDGLLDPILYSMFAAGLAFLARHSRSRATADLVLAGVALGLAFGTKFYGYTAVTAVLVVWAGCRLASRAGLATVARQGACLAALVIGVGGIWMLRNWVDIGNPLHPLGIEAFGVTLFEAAPDPLREVLGTTLISYANQPDQWGELAHQFRIAVGGPMLVLALGLIAAVVLLVRRRARGDRGHSHRVAGAAVLATLALFVVYAITPYTAPGVGGEPIFAAVNVRYGIPALIAAVAVFGWAASQAGARGVLVLEMLAALALLDTLLRIGTVTSDATVYGAFAAGAAIAVLAWLAEHREIRWPKLSPAAVATLTSVAVLGFSLWANRVENRFNASRYAGQDPTLDAIIANQDVRTVGIAGNWSHEGIAPIYPAFGNFLQHRVEYVGRSGDGLLSVHDDRAAFVEHVRAAGYDLLLIGRAPHLILDPTRLLPDQPVETVPEPRESEWARAAGYEEVARSDRLILLART